MHSFWLLLCVVKLLYSHISIFMTQNPKIRACFMQNFMELDITEILDPKTQIFGVWGLNLIQGSLGQKQRHTKP